MPPTSSKNAPLGDASSSLLGNTPQMDQETEEERKRRLQQAQQQQALARQNSYASTQLLGQI